MYERLKQNLNAHISKEKVTPFRPHNFIVDSSIYTDQNRFKLEMELLEDPFLGPIEELKVSKQFLIDETNNLKVFFNSCPHRGARFNTSSEGFTCSYHGWKFSHEGDLLQSTGHSCPYPAGTLKLKEIPVTNVGGILMKGTPCVFAQEVQSHFKSPIYLEKRTHAVKCNWKLLIESLLETYHFPFAHTPYLEGFENAFYSLGEYKDKNARIVVPLEKFDEYKDLSGLEGINMMYYFSPYSFVLFMTSGFVWFHIKPKTVNASEFTCYLFSYGTETNGARKSLDLLDKILNQDFSILEGQQVNAQVKQRFHFTGYEKLIREFHKNIESALNRSFNQN